MLADAGLGPESPGPRALAFRAATRRSTSCWCAPTDLPVRSGRRCRLRDHGHDIVRGARGIVWSSCRSALAPARSRLPSCRVAGISALDDSAARVSRRVSRVLPTRAHAWAVGLRSTLRVGGGRAAPRAGRCRWSSSSRAAAVADERAARSAPSPSRRPFCRPAGAARRRGTSRWFSQRRRDARGAQYLMLNAPEERARGIFASVPARARRACCGSRSPG